MISQLRFVQRPQPVVDFCAVRSKKLLINCTASVAADHSTPLPQPQIRWSMGLGGGGAINNVWIFSNGTLMIQRVNQYHNGIYNCTAEYDGEIIAAPVRIKG